MITATEKQNFKRNAEWANDLEDAADATALRSRGKTEVRVDARVDSETRRKQKQLERQEAVRVSCASPRY